MEIGTWLLVLAVAVAAHHFGRESRTAPRHTADSEEISRSRLGVALSITGPLAMFIVGLIVAAATEWWLPVGLGTVAAIVAITAFGLFLAPY